MLEVNNIEVVYNKAIWVLRGVSIKVDDNKIVCLLGANGAGKSTTLKAISGLLKSELGEVTRGNIEFDGVRIDHEIPQNITQTGIVHVFEGRRLFSYLTVEENLMMGAYLANNNAIYRKRIAMVYDYFPRLAEKEKEVSGYLSGGEQQMLVIARALMANPKLMLLDELSLGLAPQLVKGSLKVISEINREENVAMLVVEQNAPAALSISSYGYVMENGRIVLDGPADKLIQNEDIKEFYLGLSDLGQRKSYKEAKHYKRRKRWLA